MGGREQSSVGDAGLCESVSWVVLCSCLLSGNLGGGEPEGGVAVTCR